MNKQDLTYDYIPGTDIYLYQRKDMFRINTDTAQLARFMRVRSGDRVLDIGTNNGALLLYAARFQPSFLCGVELQPEAAELARYNLAQSEITQAEIICADFTQCRLSGFDVVVCNPPYFEQGRHGDILPTMRNIARHEFFLQLKPLIAGAAMALKENGRFYLVHRASRIPEIIEECHARRLQIKMLQLICDADKELASGVLIEAVLGGGRHCRVPKPIVIER